MYFNVVNLKRKILIKTKYLNNFKKLPGLGHYFKSTGISSIRTGTVLL